MDEERNFGNHQGLAFVQNFLQGLYEVLAAWLAGRASWPDRWTWLDPDRWSQLWGGKCVTFCKYTKKDEQHQGYVQRDVNCLSSIINNLNFHNLTFTNDRFG